MSEEEFLSRWSRRKREARVGDAEQEPAHPDAVSSPAPSAAPPAEQAVTEIDPASLPPIESIEAVTDITAFLRKGVPEELSRAALRRAWSADPAIRDFVGLAENAWDFNDPNAVPGFGPLECSAEQLEALVRRIIGGVARAAESPCDPSAEVSAPQTIAEFRAEDEPGMADMTPGPAASQSEKAETTTGSKIPVRRRTHGGALPR